MVKALDGVFPRQSPFHEKFLQWKGIKSHDHVFFPIIVAIMAAN
jgi:hypothetical protein